MTLNTYEAQQNIRKTGQLWARGMYDSNVCIVFEVLPDQSFVATAETEHITAFQFERAIKKVYETTHVVTVTRQGWPGMGGYWRADGIPKGEGA